MAIGLFLNEIRDLIIVLSYQNKAFFSFTTLFYLIVTMDERQINAKLVPEKFLKLEWLLLSFTLTKILISEFFAYPSDLPTTQIVLPFLDLQLNCFN